MKKFKLYCILGLFGCICLPTEAQVTNWVGLSIAAGEWSLMPQQGKSELQMSLGAGGTLSFHYELEAKHFLFQTGVGVNSGWTQFKVPEISQVLPNQTDIQGDKLNYLYQFPNRRDAYTPINVQIPLMVGGNWSRFYFLVGAKLNINCATWAFQKSNLTTAGDYTDPTFMGLVTGVPAQQFYGPENNIVLANKGMTAMNLIDVNAAAEIGLRMGYIQTATGYDVPQSHTQYRLALFADYGLMDCHKAQYNQPLIAPSKYDPWTEYSMITGLQMNDILSTTNIAKAVNNLLVGVKFTILFQTLPEPRCVSCEKNSPLRRRKGGTKIEL